MLDPGHLAAGWSELPMTDRIRLTLWAEGALRRDHLRDLCWGDDDTEGFDSALSALLSSGDVGVRGKYWGNAPRPYTQEYFWQGAVNE